MTRSKTSMQTIFRNVCDAAGNCSAGFAALQYFSFHAYGTSSGVAHACNDFCKFTLSVASNTSNTNNFSATNGERDAMKCITTAVVVSAKVFYVQHNVICLCRCVALYTREFHIATHHHAGEVTLIGRRCIDSANSATTTQHSDAIRHRHHFVEFVRNENNRATFGGHCAQCAKQCIGFNGCEHCSGFIENENLRTAIQNLQNFYTLLFAHTELPDASLGVNSHVVTCSKFFHALINGSSVEKKCRVGVTEHHIFCNRKSFY